MASSSSSLTRAERVQEQLKKLKDEKKEKVVISAEEEAEDESEDEFFKEVRALIQLKGKGKGKGKDAHRAHDQLLSAVHHHRLVQEGLLPEERLHQSKAQMKEALHFLAAELKLYQVFYDQHFGGDKDKGNSDDSGKGEGSDDSGDDKGNSDDSGDDDCGGDSGDMTIFVKTPSGKTITLHVEASDTIAIVKTLLKNLQGIPKNQQRLLFHSEELEDERTLSEYSIQNESILMLMTRGMGGGKRPRNRGFEKKKKDEQLMDLEASIHGTSLQLNNVQNDFLISQLLARIATTQPMTASQMISQLNMEGLTKVVSIAAGSNIDHKFESLAKVVFANEHAEIAKKRRELAMAEDLMIDVIKIKTVQQFMSPSGSIAWSGEADSSLSGHVATIIARGAYEAGQGHAAQQGQGQLDQ